ncbi:hypothetical protein L596_019611 [Steinernema carpocapsae]|uniref:Uncharacterized protein n=1 Tax=Steinernema carpocapsae TaxID=34508 RepID=A0A4U5MR40_STECR|nr:hypothetical protein L596_019611 [Steinernema carpocapsae]
MQVDQQRVTMFFCLAMMQNYIELDQRPETENSEISQAENVEAAQFLQVLRRALNETPGWHTFTNQQLGLKVNSLKQKESDLEHFPGVAMLLNAKTKFVL